MRATSAALRRAITRQETSEAFLVLLDIDYEGRLPDLLDADLRGAWLNTEVVKSADDYSSAGDDMTAVGAPTYPDDEGVVLDGAADYLRRAEAAWRPDSVGTVMGWVSRATYNTADAIFGTCDEATADDVFYVGVRADDFVEVYAESGGVTLAQVRGGSTILDATRHHVAVVSDGSSYVIYFDGVAETLTVLAGANGGQWLADVLNRDSVTIGARRHSAVADYLDGTLRDVRYYSRALGAAVISSIYRAGLLTPIRVVNDNHRLVRAGKVYTPFPFQIKMPDERDDRFASVALRIDNVDRQIVTALRGLTSPPTVALSIVLASDPSTVEAGPFNFTLRKVNYDAGAVSGTLEYEDVLREPIPGDRFTPTNFPGIFAGVS